MNGWAGSVTTLEKNTHAAWDAGQRGRVVGLRLRRTAGGNRWTGTEFAFFAQCTIALPGGEPLGRAIHDCALVIGSVPSASPVTSSTATARPSPTIFSWSSFVDGERTPFYFSAVQSIDRRLRLLVSAHLDEAKSLGASGVPVHDHLCRFHGPEFLEQSPQITVGCVIGQIADVQLLRHAETPSRTLMPNKPSPHGPLICC
jgi:hypothetical protein